MLDILIRNGQVIDGSGSNRCRADVAMEDGRIVDVGALPGATAETVIDASGLVVAPGFVDMHSHADFTLPFLPTADSLVRQGITTVVPFQCGGSPVPILPERRSELVGLMASEAGGDRLPFDRWSTFGSYLAYLEEIGVSVNVVPLVGQSTIWMNIMGGSAAAPSTDQMGRMQKLVSQAMDEGAIGLTTGLIYPPGSFATTECLIETVRPVGERNGYYFSHIRGEGGTLLTALQEAIRIGRETGASVEISHFKAAGRDHWGLVHSALDVIAKARSEGQDVSADLYPYMAGSASLVSMLPEWAQEGGPADTIERLVDPATRARIAVDMRTSGYFKEAVWSETLIGASPHNPAYEGRSIAELAEAAHQAPTEWVMDALIETRLDLRMIVFGMSEDNRKIELAQPWMMIGTDGYGFRAESIAPTDGLPHPRNFGTFPRILGHYVRETGNLTLEEAVHKMCGLPADKLRWTDRGLLRRGYRADVVVFDPVTVRDTSTYAKPFQYPIGIPHVLVNGRFVIRDGAHTGARPGVMLPRR